jgi:membrane protease YdiL (CAAX protease family)
MTKRRALHPLLVLLLWLIAAFVAIWTGPMFVPAANSTVRVEAVLSKIVGMSLFLGVSAYVLRKNGDGVGFEVLGLRPTIRNLAWLLAGSFVGLLLVALCFAFIRAMVPIHFEKGTMMPNQFGMSVLVYAFGAALEEVAFRGYPLLRLRERYGTLKAVLAVALAFGVLHLPGMYGADALKMVVTTGLSSIVFSIAYLGSGTLWAAIGLHMGMNVLLHSVFGGGGGSAPSFFVTTFGRQSFPFDAGFSALTLTLLLIIAAMMFVWTRVDSTQVKAQLTTA